MDTNTAKETIRVIRNERSKRLACLPDDPDAAYDLWLFTHEPFIRELCLLLLVAVWHQVEGELVWMAARAMDGGKELTGQEYSQRIEKLRNELRGQGKKGWRRIIQTLKLEASEEYCHMRTLQLFANSYKHAPSTEPTEELLDHLRTLTPESERALKRGVTYAPLAESMALQEGLAASLGLQDADCCDVADELVDRASRFLAEVQAMSVLSKIKRGPVRLDIFAH